MAEGDPLATALLILPHGPVVSGIVTWALRLARYLPSQGIEPVLLLHRVRTDHAALAVEDDRRAVHFEHVAIPATNAPEHDHRQCVRIYRDVMSRLIDRRPLIVVPNVDHACWGAAVEAVESFRCGSEEDATATSAPTRAFRADSDASAILPVRGARARLSAPSPASGQTHDRLPTDASPGRNAIAVVGWVHSHTPYDRAVAAYFEPRISAFITPSLALSRQLQLDLPTRAADVHAIAYPVGEVGPEICGNDLRIERGAAATGAEAMPGARPVRMLYTGRMDAEQKRVQDLLTIADLLSARGVSFELRLVGDGPLASWVDQRTQSRPGGTIARLPAMAPAALDEHLRWADLFLLASRYEGLSVAMLEAMSRGVIPVVSRVSGVEEVIEHGRNGFHYDPGDLVAAAACIDAWRALPRQSAMDSIDSAVAADRAAPLVSGASRGALRAAAMSTARAIAHPRRHAESVAAVFRHAIARASRPRQGGAAKAEGHHRPTAYRDEAADAVCRSPWPADRPFEMPSGGLTGLPNAQAQARGRLVAILAEAVVAGASPPRRIGVWGAGRHTLAFADLLEPCPAFVAVLDDQSPAAEPGGPVGGVDGVSQRPRCLGRPVHRPGQAASLGLTDVILSSALYEEALWQRRGEVAPAIVHRLYA